MSDTAKIDTTAFTSETEMKEHRVKYLINDPVAMAKQRLMDFAASLPMATREWEDTDGEWHSEDVGDPVTYRELIERATDHLETGEYWNEGSRFEGQGFYDTFWEDYTLVTGKPAKAGGWGFFACSC